MYGCQVWWRISGLVGGLVAGGGPVSMVGMAVGGDNAYARTREENLRTKQFFLTKRVIAFLPILPRRTAPILPSASMHQPLSAHVLLTNISICVILPPTTPKMHTHTYTRYRRTNSSDANRHACLSTPNYHHNAPNHT